MLVNRAVSEKPSVMANGRRADVVSTPVQAVTMAMEKVGANESMSPNS